MAEHSAGMPPSPITPLIEHAAQLKETFDAYVEVGFTEPHALFLVGRIIEALIVDARNVGPAE